MKSAVSARSSALRSVVKVGSGGGGGGAGGSDRGRFALQEVMVDVVCVSLEPGSIEEDVLTALLHRALRSRRRVTLKETLHEREKTSG